MHFVYSTLSCNEFKILLNAILESLVPHNICVRPRHSSSTPNAWLPKSNIHAPSNLPLVCQVIWQLRPSNDCVLPLLTPREVPGSNKLGVSERINRLITDRIAYCNRASLRPLGFDPSISSSLLSLKLPLEVFQGRDIGLSTWLYVR